MRISIPKPCHEDWDAMTPADKGRHCTACAKTVIDFTGMGALAVRRTLRETGSGSTCGRFYPDQLDRPLAAGVSASPAGWLALVAAALVGVGSAGVLAERQSGAGLPQVHAPKAERAPGACSVSRPPVSAVGQLEMGGAALAETDGPDFSEVEREMAPPRTGWIDMTETESSQPHLPSLLQ